jgi:hypothetical protein
MWKLLEALGLAELPSTTPRSRHVRPEPAKAVRSEATMVESQPVTSAPIAATNVPHSSPL